MDTVKRFLGCPIDKNKSRQTDDGDDDEDRAQDTGDAPPRVGLYDGVAMKRSLDETLAETLAMEKQLPSSKLLENIRLGIMVLAVAAGIVAHVYPHTPSHKQATWSGFTQSSVVLGLCVLVYFLLSGVWQLFVWYIEKDALFLSQPTGNGERICVRTRMRAYHPEYACAVETVNGRVLREVKRSIADFYTVDGDLSLARVDALCNDELLPAIRAALAGGSEKKTN